MFCTLVCIHKYMLLTLYRRHLQPVKRDPQGGIGSMKFPYAYGLTPSMSSKFIHFPAMKVKWAAERTNVDRKRTTNLTPSTSLARIRVWDCYQNRVHFAVIKRPVKEKES